MNLYEDMPGVKAPPYSAEAEQSVLGGLMIDGSLVDEVVEIVSVGDFFTPNHRVIFEAILKVAESGHGIDLVTVCEAIGDPSKAGGLEYIAGIAANTPSASNVRAYAKAVKRKAQERAICAAGAAISDIGYDEDKSIDEKIAESQQMVMTIGESKEEVELSLNQHLLHWVDDLDERFQNGDSFGLASGLKDIDAKTNGWQNSDLIILAARPSMGKSTLAFQMAANAAVVEETPVLIFSLEMSRKQIYNKMVSCLGGIFFDRVKKATLKEDDWPKLSATIARMKDKPLYIDDRGALHVNQVMASARRRHRKEPLGLIVIDYLQLMRGDGTNRTAEIGHISRSLKALAKELDCPVLALSQLSRSCEQRPNKRPINSDLRDSGEIEQDADIIMFIYRDEVYNGGTQDKGIAEVIYSKFRNGEIGTVRLASDLAHSRFQDLGYDYTPPPVQNKRGGGFNYED